jgi:hypothetical protein
MNVLKSLKFKAKLKSKLNFKVTAARRAEFLWKKTTLASFQSSEIPPTLLHGLGNKLSFSCKIPAPDGLKY